VFLLLRLANHPNIFPCHLELLWKCLSLLQIYPGLLLSPRTVEEKGHLYTFWRTPWTPLALGFICLTVSALRSDYATKFFCRAYLLFSAIIISQLIVLPWFSWISRWPSYRRSVGFYFFVSVVPRHAQIVVVCWHRTKHNLAWGYLSLTCGDRSYSFPGWFQRSEVAAWQLRRPSPHNSLMPNPSSLATSARLLNPHFSLLVPTTSS